MKKIKEINSLSWREIYNSLEVPKSTFEMYKSGVSCMPENLFNKLINQLDSSSKKLILFNIKRLPDNFGQVKGGKKAYALNFDKFEEGRKKGILSNKINKNKPFTFNIELSKDICEFIGAFIGDGFFNCYNNHLYQIEFSGDSRFDLKYYKETIIPIVKRIVPNVIPHIYFVKGKNAIRVTFYSKELFYFLKDFFNFTPGKKTYTVKMPDKILFNQDFVYSTIRGIFDTDGGVFLDKRKSYKKIYPRIIFQTVSKPLFNQLYSLLSKEFTLYTRFNQKRQIYIIEIYGINQVRSWMKLIGFSNQRQLDKIKLLQ